MIASVLALCAGLSWGSADFLNGLRSRRIPVVTVLTVTQVAGLLPIAIIVFARGRPMVSAHAAGYAALAGISATVGLIILYRGLARGPMGIVAPISASSALVPVTAGLALGERPTLGQGVGIGLVMVGVIWASRQADHREDGNGAATGVRMGLVAALGLGLALFALSKGSVDDPYWATLILRMTALALLLVMTLVLRPIVAVGPSDLAMLGVAGLLDAGATALFAVASTRGLLTLVGVLVNIYPVVTALLARFVLGERLSRSQRVGVSTALVGVILVTAA